MMTLDGEFRSLDFPFTVDPSGGGLSLVMAEERRDIYAVVRGYTPSLDSPDRQEVIALITLQGVLQVVFGYPNEEAYWRDPRGKLGGRLCEVVGSGWHSSLDRYNRQTYGTGLDALGLRHYFIPDKDTSAQALAGGIALDLFPRSGFREVHEKAFNRLYGTT
jgi:hypothetical protein